MLIGRNCLIYFDAVQAVDALRLRSCLIDGEAVCCDDDGLPVFQKLRQRRDDRHVYLCAFDLIELDGKDLRREPIAEPGDVVFRHACRLGLEGIVSKRLGSHYVSGRSRYWLKFKNPNAPAVKREAEEDWGKER